MMITNNNIESKKVTAEEIVEAARKYIGIPYRTQGREATGPNKGTDCGGLLLLVCRDLGIHELEVLGYSNSPDGEIFEQILSENLDEIIPKEAVQPGDIIASDYEKGIQHTMFVSETEPRIKVIHAKRGLGVTEQSLNGKDLRGWVKTYRIRSLVEG